MDQRDTIRKEVLGALKEGEQDGSIREMEYRMITQRVFFHGSGRKRCYDPPEKYCGIKS